MLVVKYYEWNYRSEIYELKVERCSEVLSSDSCHIICKRAFSNELIIVHMDQLISIKPVDRPVTMEVSEDHG